MKKSLEKRLCLIFTLALLFFSGSCIGPRSTARRLARTIAKKDAAADNTESIRHGGRDRTFIVHVPPRADKTKPLPLVIMLHGGLGNATHAVNWSGKADSAGFIAVYPNGTGRFDDKLLTWNAGNCCGYAANNNIDDTGFIRAMVEKLESEYPVDKSRIYAAGFSNGAMLAHRLGCEMSDVLAAVAPVSGSLEIEPCAPSRPVSVIIFHGTADQNVPINGGLGRKAIDRHEKKPLRYAIDFWTKHDNCPAAPEKKKLENNVELEIHSGCDAGTEVRVYIIGGGGHEWPGGTKIVPIEDDHSTAINANDEIWKFFAAHPKNKDNK